MNRAQKARYILIQDRVQRLELSFQGRYSRLSVSYRHIFFAQLTFLSLHCLVLIVYSHFVHILVSDKRCVHWTYSSLEGLISNVSASFNTNCIQST